MDIFYPGMTVDDLLKDHAKSEEAIKREETLANFKEQATDTSDKPKNFIQRIIKKLAHN